MTAALAGTATLVGNSATDSRVVRPVYPGDTIDLYMIGLGSASVTAKLSGEPAKVVFAGLTAPGLYLVRIVTPPDVPAGAQPFEVSAGGIQTRPSLVLQVAVAPPA